MRPLSCDTDCQFYHTAYGRCLRRLPPGKSPADVVPNCDFSGYGRQDERLTCVLASPVIVPGEPDECRRRIATALETIAVELAGTNAVLGQIALELRLR